MKLNKAFAFLKNPTSLTLLLPQELFPFNKILFLIENLASRVNYVYELVPKLFL